MPEGDNLNLITEALIALVLAGLVGIAGFWQGDKFGIAKQKATDQTAFDTINKERTQQKTDADAILAKANADIITKQQENAALNAKLEKQDATYQAATTALRAQLSTRSLRFAVPAKSAAHRSCGASASGAAASSAQPAAAPSVRLPSLLTSNLRQLSFDAAVLAGNYAKCKEWVESK